MISGLNSAPAFPLAKRAHIQMCLLIWRCVYSYKDASTHRKMCQLIERCVYRRLQGSNQIRRERITRMSLRKRKGKRTIMSQLRIQSARLIVAQQSTALARKVAKPNESWIIWGSATEPQIINFHFNSWGFAAPNPHFTCPKTHAGSKRQDANTKQTECRARKEDKKTRWIQ